MTMLVVTWVALGAAVLAFGWRVSKLIRPMLGARPDARFEKPLIRVRGLLAALGHKRLLKVPYAGTLHAMIFVSFFVLSTAIIESFGSSLFEGFSLAPLGGNTWIALSQDVFALVMLGGVALATVQRYVFRPARFNGSNARDATLIYGLILAIVVSMLAETALGIASGSRQADGWRPVSSLIAAAFSASGLSAADAATAELITHWVHIGWILVFLIYIPGSKHRHMFLAAPNIYFRSLQPKGRIATPIPETLPAPLATPSDFSWKDMLDVYSCTECGRCQAACPAYAAGLPLSPKTLITDLRDHFLEEPLHSPIIGVTISEETLWACTTCRACMDVCPVHIEHLPKIVGMRRTLIDDGKISPSLQDALSNLQRVGNSMGAAAKMRAKWTKDLPFRIKDARREPVDVLWFVGDYASYDPRANEVTRTVAQLFERAGLDFGILYESERNSGNDVHRVGEEGLFETLAKENIDVLASCSFNRIVTTDPHSLNALAQEYGSFGATYEVVHYSALLLELVESGRLSLSRKQEATVTYHDPCYLGRYNGGFDAPRALIARAGYELQDMGRCRENSFCCGAGGGRIWQDETGVKERPSENRIKEALALGNASLFVVSCPKDKVMYGVAVDALGVGDQIKVVDLADLVMSALAPATE